MQLTQDQDVFIIDTHRLGLLLRKLKPTLIPDKASAHYTNCVSLKTAPKELEFCSTNGHCMTVVREKCLPRKGENETELPEWQAVVPWGIFEQSCKLAILSAESMEYKSYIGMVARDGKLLLGVMPSSEKEHSAPTFIEIAVAEHRYPKYTSALATFEQAASAESNLNRLNYNSDLLVKVLAWPRSHRDKDIQSVILNAGSGLLVYFDSYPQKEIGSMAVRIVMAMHIE